MYYPYTWQKNIKYSFFPGGLALWELTDNLHTFIEQSSATEHDDMVSSVCICKEQNTAISASYDKWYGFK